MKINIIYIDSEQKLRESKQRWETYTNTWMEDKLTRKIVDRKQFFVYKLTSKGIDLYILDGLKTNPPMKVDLGNEFEGNPLDYEYIIPGVRSSDYYEKIDHVNKYDGKRNYIISTKRNDKKVIELFKPAIDNIIQSLEKSRESINKQLRQYRALRKRD